MNERGLTPNLSPANWPELDGSITVVWNHEQTDGSQNGERGSKEKRCGGTVPIPKKSGKKTGRKCCYAQGRIEDAVGRSAELLGD